MRIYLALILGLGMVALSLKGYAQQTSIDRFFERIQFLSVDFEQLVINPKKKLDEHSKGNILIKKPGHYRWRYQSPSPLLIVSDSKSEWIYDEGLAQVIIRDSARSIGMPAHILSGQSNWKRDYDVSVKKTSNSREIMTLTPKKNNQEQIASIKVLTSEDVLHAIEIQDALGYSTRIIFSNYRFRNPKARTASYRPEFPEGTDIIDQRSARQ